MSATRDLDHERLHALLENFAKNWLAHDGLWFQAVEAAHGLDEAIRLDTEAWRRFSPIEARRIKEFLGLPDRGGLDALEKALAFRLYAVINRQRVERTDRGTLRFFMDECRVQAARRGKGLPDFPCKTVGIVEYSEFARTIDPRIRTTCLACPPDAGERDWFCGWEFSLDG